MKRFRMFAGPNGSGKSTLIEDVKKYYNVGYFINADVIESALKTKGFIHCDDYLPTEISQSDWNDFLQYAENKRIDLNKLQQIHIVDNILVCTGAIDSYIAASVANFFREMLLKQQNTFSFETVMSHPSKVDFLKKAKNNGFKTYFYFITTQDPTINIKRIGFRVSKGGHNVSEEKIIERYYRTMDLLYDAFVIADTAFIFDNSSEDDRSLLIEKKENKLYFLQENIPEWVKIYLLDKINY